MEQIQINFLVMFNKCVSYNHWYLIRCPDTGLWFGLMLLVMIKGSDYWLLSQWIMPSGNKYSILLDYTVICVEVRDWRNSVRKSVSDLQKIYIIEIAFLFHRTQIYPQCRARSLYRIYYANHSMMHPYSFRAYLLIIFVGTQLYVVYLLKFIS